MGRRVGRCGKIGLYHDKVYVGAALRGRPVVVQFGPEPAERAVADTGGAEPGRRPLTRFGPDSLRGLPGS